MKEITSVQNPLIKTLIQLQEKAKTRRQTGLFLIEGQREIELALMGGYELETVLFLADKFDESRLPSGNFETIRIAKEVYEKVAYRESTEGILALAKTRKHTLDNLKLPENPLILVAESPEKPGNIGALLRTADAAGVDAAIIANPNTDLYNPNIVRSSVGCLFTTQIGTASTDEVISFLQQKSISIFSATLQDATDYAQEDFTGPTALVVGTEATGLTQAWRESSKQNILIPMRGKIDSMNVSVAAAVLIFEAVRQRNLK